jgi:hypothetical protein
MRVYTLSVRNRAVATLLVLAAIGLGVAFLAIGFAVLAGLAVGGAVLGTGAAIYNRLRGRQPTTIAPSEPSLDPSLEVFPEERPRQLPPV